MPSVMWWASSNQLRTCLAQKADPLRNKKELPLSEFLELDIALFPAAGLRLKHQLFLSLKPAFQTEVDAVGSLACQKSEIY